jgi:heme/copper-type cytochrome/quinol oxidase subunit 1
LFTCTADDDLLVHHPDDHGAFGNYFVPLMIGARDMAFPRLNALSFWVFLASGIFLYIGLFTGFGPNAGWFDYVPLASRLYDPGANIEFYALGLLFNGLSSTLAAANFIVTIFKCRAPGMSFNRMPALLLRPARRPRSASCSRCRRSRST